MVVHAHSDQGILQCRQMGGAPYARHCDRAANSLYDSDEPKKGKKSRDANLPQRDSDVAARDEEGEALAALPIVREEPIINIEDNDLNEVAEDNAGHLEQADPDDAISVAAEHGNQAGEESVSETPEMLDRPPADGATMTIWQPLKVTRPC
jgi:hypothetical protein